MAQVFKTSENRKKFLRHLKKSGAITRIGAFAALTLKYVFGDLLKRIPILSILDGPISALIAMHNLEIDQYQELGISADKTYTCTLSKKTSFDLIIAGSGPGGSLVANRSANAGLSVLVVEQGDLINDKIPHHTPKQMEEFFELGGQEIALSVKPMPFAQGKALGGGSEINSGLYHRLPQKVLQDWLSKLEGVSETDFANSAEKIETEIHVARQPKSSLGLYSKSPIIDMADNLGWDSDLIPRWRKYSGMKFEHFGMSTTLLHDAQKNGVDVLLRHRVVKFNIQRDKVLVTLKGPNCKHTQVAKNLCLAAGVVNTPKILIKSKFARTRDFVFGFHAMLREAVLFDRPVNDLHDIDPHQTWSNDGMFKIGAAVGTRELLASTLASKGVTESNDLEKIGTFYISTPSAGRSGFVNILGQLIPYFLPDQSMKQRLVEAADILRNASQDVGGAPLGEKSLSISTVHVFGSLPLGSTRLLDQNGFVKKTNGLVFVRDASILPSAPLVNPQGPLMVLVDVLESNRLKGL